MLIVFRYIDARSKTVYLHNSWHPTERDPQSRPHSYTYLTLGYGSRQQIQRHVKMYKNINVTYAHKGNTKAGKAVPRRFRPNTERFSPATVLDRSFFAIRLLE